MNQKHIVALDGLRAIAALAVFSQHISQQFAHGQLPNSLGWAGVTLFFLLSGFCIHYPKALSQNGQIRTLDFKEFAKRRLLRIFPAYIAVLLISYSIGQYQETNLLGKYHGSHDFWMHIFFIHNLSPDTFYSINAVFWSIAIEIQFYLIYALFYQYFRFTLKESALFFVLGLACYCLVSLVFSSPWREVLQRSFVATFWIWHLGAVMATMFAHREGRVNKAHYGLVLVALVLVCTVDPVIFRLHVVYWIGPLVFAVFIWKTLAFTTPGILNYIGKISYSLYLLHPIAIALAIGWIGVYPQYWALPLGLTLAAGGYYTLEAPFIKLRQSKIRN
jgi:peptidoglycan/LPS O-acetylase OafA/YrhL